MHLWLDDCRPMPGDYDVWVKTYDEAIEHLKTGKVTRISFDNDLGTEKEGYDVAKWIMEQAYHGNIPALGWTIHSANPVGRSNILGAMKNADKYWGLGSDDVPDNIRAAVRGTTYPYWGLGSDDDVPNNIRAAIHSSAASYQDLFRDLAVAIDQF